MADAPSPPFQGGYEMVMKKYDVLLRYLHCIIRTQEGNEKKLAKEALTKIGRSFHHTVRVGQIWEAPWWHKRKDKRFRIEAIKDGHVTTRFLDGFQGRGTRLSRFYLTRACPYRLLKDVKESGSGI